MACIAFCEAVGVLVVSLANFPIFLLLKPPLLITVFTDHWFTRMRCSSTSVGEVELGSTGKCLHNAEVDSNFSVDFNKREYPQQRKKHSNVLSGWFLIVHRRKLFPTLYSSKAKLF